MSRSAVLALAFLLVGEARGLAQPPPPKVAAVAVTWTTIEIAIVPTSSARCLLSFGDSGVSHIVVASGPFHEQLARVVGLRPDTKYTYRVLCGGSDGVSVTARTDIAPQTLPAAPQVLSIAFGPSNAKVASATASFVPPAGLPTACWWESWRKGEEFPQPISETDCTTLNGTSPAKLFPSGARVRFGMRNAAGNAYGAAVMVP